jgi:DNA polymerase-1
VSDRPRTSGPLFVLDGMSLAFRAYFALPPELALKDGTVTNAVHGFTSMLVYLVREHRPSAIAVAFDPPGPTFRDGLNPEYKAGRAETPHELGPQFDMIRRTVASLAIPLVEVQGFEADDVLATLATQARDRGTDVVVVTGDRDCFQLVEDPHIRVLYNRRGVSDYALYTEAGIEERTGVLPPKYPMLAALRGDPSDNIVGVPGVGEKTAAKLLNTHGDIDGIYANLDSLTPKLRANLAEAEDRVRANLLLIPLVRDVPLDVRVEDLSLGGWDLETARTCFSDLELKSTWDRVVPLLQDGTLGPPAPGSASAGPGVEVVTTDVAADDAVFADISVVVQPVDAIPPPEAEMPDTADEAARLLGALVAGAGEGPIGIAGVSQGLAGRAPLFGLAVVSGGPSARAVWIAEALLSSAQVRAALADLATHPVVGHETKELLRSLLGLGIGGFEPVLDTAVAAYLLDPSKGDYSLGEVAAPFFNGAVEERAEMEPQGQLALDGPVPADVARGAVEEASIVTQLVAPLRAAVGAAGMLSLLDEVESPLIGVLARMEVAGIRVDTDELRRVSKELVADVAALETEVHELAGHPFNVNSTPQLRTVLYDELGLKPGRRTKTGYSTDAATLEGLRDQHPIVETLLRYRELEKLRSTYGENLLAEVKDDGRIHASFRQTVARTGRLSSEHPNLHNIPVRSDSGRRFRRVFIPAPGFEFLVADYDQIELRVLAHLAADPGLLEAFSSGTDIHRAVASGVYGVPVDEVTRTQREFSKMVSYGLAYGMEAYGLARRLATGVEEAAEIMGRYFGAFPAVRAYMDDTVVEARRRGYTRTAFGRIRPLPELSDRNFRVRQAAERQAMNAGIQGLAADLFKAALVRVDHALAEGRFTSRLVLQVHDEVIVEVAKEEKEAVGPLVRRALTGAAELSVPLEVSMAWGASWAEAKAG